MERLGLRGRLNVNPSLRAGTLREAELRRLYENVDASNNAHPLAAVDVPYKIITVVSSHCERKIIFAWRCNLCPRHRT